FRFRDPLRQALLHLLEIRHRAFHFYFQHSRVILPVWTVDFLRFSGRIILTKDTKLHEERIMTADEFRSMALGLPEAVEQAHMDHPDFRVRGKIFATLGPDEAWGMVKLTPDQQQELVRRHPKVFQPFNGAW